MVPKSEPSELYYPVTESHPPMDVVVKVVWGAWQGYGKRVRARNRRTRWVKVSSRGQSVGEAIEPSFSHKVIGRSQTLSRIEAAMLWAPTEPETWVHGLPEPVTPTKTCGQEVAAELTAKHGRAGQRKRWWLVPSKITYSAMGSISQGEAEGRVMRALASEDQHRIVQGLGLHRLKYFRSQHDEPDGEIHLPLVQNGLDIDDYSLAMSWFTGLQNENPEAACVLAYAAHCDDSWAGLARSFPSAEQMAMSSYKFRQLYDCGMETIFKIANGVRTPGVVAKERNLESLKRSGVRKQAR